MTTSPNISRYFGSLRAETEASWLLDAYLPPHIFGQMTETRSILVTGEEGSGKTALELYLKDYAAQNSPRLLTTSWLPVLAEEDLSSGQVAELFVSQAMDALSLAFLQRIAREPVPYDNAPLWARDFIHWFVQAFLRGDRQYHLSRIIDGGTSKGLETVTHLLNDPPRDVFSRDAQPSSILSHLSSALQSLAMEGVWIFVDGLDTLFRVFPERLEKFIANFFSTLDLFEEDTFAFKVIISSELEARLLKTRGVLTRRFGTYQLRWSEEELVRLTENRIALSTQQDDLSLTHVCKDPKWLNWLKKYAGLAPRGWLELTRPILVAYLEKGESLTQAEWLEAYRQSPPRLHLDLDTGRVFIGWGEVTVTGIGYKLLRYLYENRQRPCTKSELYYRVHRGLNQEPRSKENAGWEDVRGWEGALDTAVYRLRQAVEWDLRGGVAPLYINSERGKGQIFLQNAI